MPNLDEIKALLEIGAANCETCGYLGEEELYNFGEETNQYPVCNRPGSIATFHRDFPFTEEQACWTLKVELTCFGECLENDEKGAGGTV